MFLTQQQISNIQNSHLNDWLCYSYNCYARSPSPQISYTFFGHPQEVLDDLYPPVHVKTSLHANHFINECVQFPELGYPEVAPLVHWPRYKPSGCHYYHIDFNTPIDCPPEEHPFWEWWSLYGHTVRTFPEHFDASYVRRLGAMTHSDFRYFSCFETMAHFAFHDYNPSYFITTSLSRRTDWQNPWTLAWYQDVLTATAHEIITFCEANHRVPTTLEPYNFDPAFQLLQREGGHWRIRWHNPGPVISFHPDSSDSEDEVSEAPTTPRHNDDSDTSDGEQ